MKPRVQRFIEECEELLLQCTEVPAAGDEYAASVSARVKSMKRWAEEKGHVTEKMERALENMSGGISRWLENRGDR